MAFRLLLLGAFLGASLARADDPPDPPRPRSQVQAPAGRAVRPPAPPPSSAPDWASLGLSGRNSAIIGEMEDRIRRGEQVDPFYYFSLLVGVDEARLHDVIHAFLLRTAGGGPPPPMLGARLYMEYLRHHPGSAVGYAGLARSWAQQGNYPNAVASYTKAIGLGGAAPDNYYGRGAAAEELGDHQLAYQDAAQALAVDAKNPQAQALAKLSEGRPSKVILDPATGKPDPSQAAPARRESDQELLGVIPWDSERAGTRSSPIQTSADMTQVAQRFLQLSDARSALDAAAKAAQLDPRNAKALNLLATAELRAGDNAAALSAADRAIALAPSSGAARTTRSWALNGLKRFQEALDESNRALAYAPHEAFAHLTKARALGGLGRRPQMQDALRQAAALDPRLADLSASADRLPDSQDSELLFNGLQGPRPAPRRDGSRLLGPLLLILATLLGGALVALGFLRVFSTPWGERLTTRLARRAAQPPARAGSSVEDGPALAPYEIRKVIATGGMGVVYEALDKALKRRVAIKKLRGEIREDPAERERFLREAHTVAALSHPNIVRIHGIFEEGRDIYLVFEYAEGETLKERLRSRGKLPLPEASAVFSGVCSALDYAHGRGIIHRDLKPSNIMVREDGQALVMDFGVARQAKDAMAKAALTHTVIGTPAYMAPEAENGVVRRESDIYSLGI
ncbi:MAG TPA: protein kinase, partial [Elusimicrobiota bacterium]|nr:protein kinase [Elusimicrobiota bacterium]